MYQKVPQFVTNFDCQYLWLQAIFFISVLNLGQDVEEDSVCANPLWRGRGRDPEAGGHGVV